MRPPRPRVYDPGAMGAVFTRRRVLVAAWITTGLCLAAFVAFRVLVWTMIPREVTRVSRYAEIRLQLWRRPELIEHFPEMIPPEAEEPRLVFYPGLAQAGAYFQLAMKLPANKVSRLRDEFTALDSLTFRGGDTNDHMNAERSAPTTFYYTSGTGEHSFPDDFELYVLDEVPDEWPEGHYFNHGESHGVAVSTKRNTVVYWAEAW